ncbi:MFS transporter [Nocardioides renjunii]|uniref:MFS transporter n=1 Tax=Nocardioides renjunii TaxID=3095075 RepID=UPI002B002712|nr:MFS transporter [Nocardioides sp. S-34]WQQ22906.1 MFS transporter [Nocardioides sp. S-34]
MDGTGTEDGTEDRSRSAPPRESWWRRQLPPSPLARSLSVQSILFAVGEGTFITGSAVFFTQIVGLSPAQVGIGLTVAGITSFFFAVPSGKLADRVGTRRTWAVSAFLTSALYLVWPFIHGFAAYLLMMVVLEVVSQAGWSGRGAYTLDIFTREERVESQAFMRAALNIGFTLGALIGGLALATDSDAVVRAVPILTGAILLANAWWITRLPDPPARAVTTHADDATIKPAALKNRAFLALMTGDGVLGTNQVLLNIVIPLWLVEETDAPRVLLAWLFGTNTVMAVLLQVAAARGVDSVARSLRASYISAGFFVLSCAIVLVTHDTLGWLTIFLVWLGHVTVTGAELFQSAGSWGFQSELTDPDQRAEYQGAAHIGHTAGSVWAPALFTWLALEQGSLGWVVIAAIVVVSTLTMAPSARAAERYLARHGSAA